MIPQETVASFLTRALLKSADAFAAAVPRVMDDTDEAAVHDVRVAIRRLRVLLLLARPVFGREPVDAVRKVYAALQDATNSLRDLEVLSETIHSLKLKHIGFKAVRAGKGAAALRLQLIELCQSGSVERARTQLEALLELPIKPPGRLPPDAWARQSAEAARAQVAKRIRKGRGPTGLHRLRLTFKRLRYTVELLTEVLPPRLQALAPLAARAQKALGEIHDLDVAIDQVKHSDLFPDGHRSKGKAALEHTRKQKARRLKEDALDAFA